MLKFKEAIFQNSDFAVFNKPSGFNTHAQDPIHPGFVEIAEQNLLGLTSKKFKVVHRLDRGTSGLLIVALNESSAKTFFELFSQHRIQKTYLFVSDQKMPFQKISVSGEIQESKQSKRTFLLTNGKKESSPRELKRTESWTDFEMLQDMGAYQLWKASPKTGRPHQIRLHAQFLRMPILGDIIYGGTPFPRIMLHAESLEFSLGSMQFQFHCDFPEIKLLEENPHSAEFAMHSGLSHRERYLSWQAEDCLRICHLESEPLKVDRYGKVDWFYWYSEEEFPIDWIEKQSAIYDQTGRQFHFRRMTNRGSQKQAQQEIWSHPKASKEWTAEENGVKYLLKSDQGLSPGLFLDQRDQRQWLLENAKGKKVLNLFAYTCGFSVCAARAGASEVVSVDTSKKLLDWGKENFKLNEFKPESYGFFAQDVFLYIKGAVKRKLQYDVIICDPPSFGRSQEGVWSITKDLPKLLKELPKILAPRGQIVLTTNYEGWEEDKFRDVVESALKGQQIKIIKPLRSGYDFEPGSSPTTLLKGFLLIKS